MFSIVFKSGDCEGQSDNIHTFHFPNKPEYGSIDGIGHRHAQKSGFFIHFTYLIHSNNYLNLAR